MGQGPTIGQDNQPLVKSTSSFSSVASHSQAYYVFCLCWW